MKFLYIVRHAKTIHGDGHLKDFERYLKPRGEKEAKLMADFVAANHSIPELLIASPAKRATQTAEIFAEVFDYDKDQIQYERSIYFGGMGDLLEIFQNLPPNIHNVMLIGHNPTVFEMVNYFISAPVYHFPTCCVTGIKFNIDNWIELRAHRGQLTIYEKPSELK